MKRLLLPALLALASCSCIGVQSQIRLNRDGSGTLQLDYRVPHVFREGSTLPLPASADRLRQSVQAAPGLSLASLSQRDDEQDVRITASVAFDRVESLNALGSQLDFSYTAATDGFVFRQRLYPGQARAGFSGEALRLIEAFFPGYELSLRLDSPVPIRSSALGELAEDRRSVMYRASTAELLKQKNEVTLEVTW